MPAKWESDGFFDPDLFDPDIFDVDVGQGWSAGSSGSWGARTTSSWSDFPDTE